MAASWRLQDCSVFRQVRTFGVGERLGMKVDGENGTVKEIQNGVARLCCLVVWHVVRCLFACCLSVAVRHSAPLVRPLRHCSGSAGLSAHAQGVQVGWVVVAVNGARVPADMVTQAIKRAIDARSAVELTFRSCGDGDLNGDSHWTIVEPEPEPEPEPVAKVCGRQSVFGCGRVCRRRGNASAVSSSAVRVRNGAISRCVLWRSCHGRR